MKKNAIAFMLSLILFESCSKNDSSPDIDTREKEIKSYKSVFASGNVATHYFKNNSETHEIFEGKKTANFEYNNDGTLKIYTKYDTSNIEIMEFKYSNDGKITSIFETNIYSNWPDKTFERKISYQGNTISYEIPHNFYSSDKFIITFVLNTNGLLNEFTQKRKSDNQIEANFKFEYDNNQNCTKVISERYLGGNVMKSTLNYSYDDKINPVYLNYNTNYLAYLFIYDEANFFGQDLSMLVRIFGKNNISDGSTVYFSYDYDGNYPKKATVKQKGTNTLSYTTEFNY